MHLNPSALEGFRQAFSSLLDADSVVDGSARTQLRLLLLLGKVLSRDGAKMPDATVRAINATVPGVLSGTSYMDGAFVVLEEQEPFRRALIAKRELRRQAEAAHEV